MRICYIAKHDSGGGDDEGAITHALHQLGHTVERLREQRGHVAHKLNGDFLLFHKWEDMVTLKRLRALNKMPLVFWYFDLVDYPDPSLESRNIMRRRWMQDVMQFAHLGFCTDGDWVAKDKSGRLVHLMQGADERLMGVGIPTSPKQNMLLFTGIKRGGQGRFSFVEEMERHYQGLLTQINHHCHGKDLANTIADHMMVLAPDHPITDRYWSNRVYMTLGFQGFLFHPASKGLEEHYTPGKDLVTYSSRKDLVAKIMDYRGRFTDRAMIAQQGYQTTLERHTYRHRCETLIQTVKERLGV